MKKKKKLSSERFAILVTFFFVILIGISSCASKPAARKTEFYVDLTKNSKFFILPPRDIEKPMDMAQHISASFGRQNHFINAWVKADETKIEMSMFNEMGATMGELFFEEGFIDFKSSVIPEFFGPEFIIADFQVCFYDPHSLSISLKKCGLNLNVDNDNRYIMRRNNLIIEIPKTNSRVTLVNYLRGYTYSIEGDFE
jgi:hypothetical protein